MFGRRITLFRLFGFAVRIDASWLIIAALIVWSLAAGVFPQEFKGLAVSSYWWMALVAALAFFASIVFHEMCHSLVANHYQLPMKGITLFVFGGVAEMGSEPQNPKVEFLMAIAGPISSIVLGVVFYAIRMAGEGVWPIEVIGVLSYLAWINLVLAAFNLVPAFPLDGGRVLRAVLWHFQGDLRRATRIASLIGSGFGVLLMIFGFYQLFYGFVISAMWYFLIGMFLRGASRASYEQILLRSALAGEPVEHFMHPDPVNVPPNISIRRLVEDYIYRYHFKAFPVVAGSQDLTGCVTTQDVKSVPREEWDQHTVSEIAKPCTADNTVDPHTDALKVLSKMQETGSGSLLVTERGHLLGIVSVKDLLQYLAAKLDLEGNSSRKPGTVPILTSRN
jgi:Zn-dependent protease/CBS domain-containing protein